MAKLSAHGKELDRREYPSFRVAVMGDGHILRDNGQGWKLWKQIKPDVDPVGYAAKVRAQYDARPAIFHEYIKALRAAVSLEFRGRLHVLVELMPNDPDGVTVEFNDSTRYSDSGIDLDEAVELCRIYSAARMHDAEPLDSKVAQ